MSLTISVKKNLFISLAVWFLVIVLIRIVQGLKFVPFIYENSSAFTALLLVYPPVLLSMKFKDRISYWKLDRESFVYSLRIFLIICLIVFPAAFFVNHFCQMIIFYKGYHAGTSPYLVTHIVVQLLLIAFPEEFFFRGFLQEAIHRVLPPNKKVFGVPFGWGIIILSLIFAFSHSIISLQWWHAFIFFPALVFSWLKEKTGTIWAPALFHWACNVFAFWVAMHY